MRRSIKAILLLAFATTACILPGCYREVVSAKGLGAAAYQDEIGKGGNYSGLSFDDAEREPRRTYTIPGAGGSARPVKRD